MIQVTMKQIGLVVLLGIVLLSSYHFYRKGTTRQLSEELHAVRDKVNREQLFELQIKEQSRRLSGATDLAAFVESLFRSSQLVGVTDHEVTTGQARERSQVRRSRKSQRQDAGESLKVNRLQVVLHGDFRSIAEYLREIQQLDRLKQVVRFDITPDKDSLRMLLLLDLYSLKGLE